MKRNRRIKFFAAVVYLTVFTAFFDFIFNPLGLGPEPETVLPQSFFAMPAHDLQHLELLIDGEEAVEKIREEILGSESSVYLQVFIWKDDGIGRRLANALKSLAADKRFHANAYLIESIYWAIRGDAESAKLDLDRALELAQDEPAILLHVLIAQAEFHAHGVVGGDPTALHNLNPFREGAPGYREIDAPLLFQALS